MQYFIYALIDPRNEKVAYVGKTSRVDKRFREHLRRQQGSAKYQWIQELLNENLNPVCEVLETISDPTNVDPGERECFWINYYRNRGEARFNVKTSPSQLIKNFYAKVAFLASLASLPKIANPDVKRAIDRFFSWNGINHPIDQDEWLMRLSLMEHAQIEMLPRYTIHDLIVHLPYTIEEFSCISGISHNFMRKICAGETVTAWNADAFFLYMSWIYEQDISASNVDGVNYNDAVGATDD